jgi:hypothetical protein
MKTYISPSCIKNEIETRDVITASSEVSQSGDVTNVSSSGNAILDMINKANQALTR